MQIELTKKENQLLIENKSTKEISNILNISEKTVRNHISNVMQKLDVINRSNAIIELLKLNEEPIKLIALLSSKFRLMFQASELAKKGYTEDQISEILGVHKYPVHLAIVSGYKYNPKILIKYLNDLADLDIGIKTGEKDNKLALELFILNL